MRHRTALRLTQAVRRDLESPSYGKVATICIVLGLADLGNQLAGDSFFPGGPFDEIAHLTTTLVVLWALGPGVCRRLLVPALIASVAIDLDHVPDRLGYDFFTAGTPRPYTHSLLTIVIVLALAATSTRRRNVWLGVALGLGIHFFRDLAEHGSGVALLWPATDHSFSIPHAVYLAAMAACALAVVARMRWDPLRRTHDPLKKLSKVQGGSSR